MNFPVLDEFKRLLFGLDTVQCHYCHRCGLTWRLYPVWVGSAANPTRIGDQVAVCEECMPGAKTKLFREAYGG